MATRKTAGSAASKPARKSSGSSSNKETSSDKRTTAKTSASGSSTSGRTSKTAAATASKAAPKRTTRKAPEDPLMKKAAETQQILDMIERTSFAGDEREVADELSAVDQHPADHADITLQREIDYTIRDIVDDDLVQIQEAMKRKEAGTYGICENCGRKIPKARLEARPEATRCIDCQRKFEGERAS
jgi:DnaK suppressor protein